MNKKDHKDKGIAYFNDHAEDLFKQYSQIDFEKVLEALLRHMDTSGETPYHILDIGAGGGQTAHYLSQHFNAHVTALEPAEKLLEFAKERYSSAHITWQQDQLPALNSVSSKFNVLILSAIWQYLDPADYQESFKRLCALSEKDALIYLSYPTPASREYQKDVDPEDVRKRFSQHFEILEDRLQIDTKGRKALNGEALYFHTLVFKKL